MRPSHPNFVLGSIFDPFWLSTSTPWIPQNHWFFLRKNEVFGKNRLWKITSIFARSWRPTCLHFAPQNPENRLKIEPQEASKFCLFFASIFDRFWLRFGGQVGAMLATKTAPRRPQDGPGGLQGGAPGGVCISRSPKTPPGRLPGSRSPPGGRFL